MNNIRNCINISYKYITLCLCQYTKHIIYKIINIAVTYFWSNFISYGYDYQYLNFALLYRMHMGIRKKWDNILNHLSYHMFGWGWGIINDGVNDSIPLQTKYGIGRIIPFIFSLSYLMLSCYILVIKCLQGKYEDCIIKVWKWMKEEVWKKKKKGIGLTLIKYFY